MINNQRGNRRNNENDSTQKRHCETDFKNALYSKMEKDVDPKALAKFREKPFHHKRSE